MEDPVQNVTQMCVIGVLGIQLWLYHFLAGYDW